MFTLSSRPNMKRKFAALVSMTVLAVQFIGCAAPSSYTTREYPTVPKPSTDNTDYQTWAAYYSDQFQSLGDKVVPPPASHPDAAKKAFADAKLAYDQQVSAGKHQWNQSKKNANTMYYVLGAVAAGIVLFNVAF